MASIHLRVCSLKGSAVGDAGCAALCSGLATSPSLGFLAYVCNGELLPHDVVLYAGATLVLMTNIGAGFAHVETNLGRSV